MRAAIVGASGTPYHDGLFFFDICFPPEYPNEPPVSFRMYFFGFSVNYITFMLQQFLILSLWPLKSLADGALHFWRIKNKS